MKLRPYSPDHPESDQPTLDGMAALYSYWQARVILPEICSLEGIYRQAFELILPLGQDTASASCIDLTSFFLKNLPPDA